MQLKADRKQLAMSYPAGVCGSVPSKCVQFRDPRLNRIEEIRPKAVGSSISDVFSNFDKSQLKVAADAISGAAAEHVSMDVSVKFGDSRSRRSRHIRATQFVMDERRTTADCMEKPFVVFCLKCLKMV